MSQPAAPSATPAKCQACHGPLATPVFCDHCRSLFPGERLSHFELLGLPVAFELNPESLRQRYLQLSRWVHPDHHAAPAQAETSLRLSAQLNDAYRVLGDPVLRAEYLLELSGGKSGADDRSVCPGVLHETLALRDAAADAKASGDHNTLKRVQGEARQHFERTLARIRELAAALPGTDETRAELRATLNSIKYFHKLLADV